MRRIEIGLVVLFIAALLFSACAPQVQDAKARIGTDAEVSMLSADSYTIVVDGNTYSPEWFVEHTAEEYYNAGITFDIFNEHFEALLTPCNKEQREYLHEQFWFLKEITAMFRGSCGYDGALDMTEKMLFAFSVEKRVTDLIDKENYEAWENTFEPWVGTGTRSLDEFNMYTLITEFDIPRDKIEEICRKYKELYDEDYFTPEQVEAIYNGTKVEVYTLFANPHAVVVDGKIFTPQWMVEHSASEYWEAGITYEILEEEFESLLIPCNEEQREYLNEQLGYLKELTPMLSQTCSCDGDWDMTREMLLDFSLESRVINLVEKEEYEKWQATFEPWVGTGTRTLYEFNMYTFIKEFNIPRDKIEEICREHKEMFDADYFKPEQVEAIYNGTEAEVYALFANPYAVMVGRQAYSPHWMVEHTAEEYLDVGITYEILKNEFEQLLIPCNEEQKEHLNKQLEALKKLK